MKRSIGLLLVIVGVILLVQGASRKDSLTGNVDEFRAKVASKVDGDTRVPRHEFYLASGLVLVVAGAVLALKK